MTAQDLLSSARRLGPEGRPRVLFLHGMDGLVFSDPFLNALAQDFAVIAPEHPGWGTTARADHLRTIDDLAYVYLDAIDALQEESAGPVHLVGVSLGAWLAAEILTKSGAGIGRVVLAAPVGVRTGAPTVRRYLDLYASPPEVVQEALYGDAAHAPALARLTDEQFEQLARAQEATTFFGWEPYLHSPGLVERLHRITAPTLLVHGEWDGVVLDDHVVRTLAQELTEAEIAELPARGHRLEERAPQPLAALVAGFIRSTD
jgi:pimeloyl-ACP methyl ester carboxylesterase